MPKFLFSLSLVLAAFIFAAPAHAESQIFTGNMPTIDNQQAKADAVKELLMRRQGFIRPDRLILSLKQYPYMEDGQFAIELRVPDVVSGCYEYGPLEYEANFDVEDYLDINVSRYKRTPMKVSAPHIECPGSNKMTTAQIILNKFDLIDRNVKTIRFDSGGAKDNYSVEISEDKIILKPKSMRVFRPAKLSDLILSFGKGNMVALHVPMAKPGDDISAKLESLATRFGLTSAPKTPMSSNQYIFMDPEGDVLDRIGDETYSEIGDIIVGRPYQGPNGIEMREHSLRVFATRPGTRL